MVPCIIVVRKRASVRGAYAGLWMGMGVMSYPPFGELYNDEGDVLKRMTHSGGGVSVIRKLEVYVMVLRVQ